MGKPLYKIPAADRSNPRISRPAPVRPTAELKPPRRRPAHPTSDGRRSVDRTGMIELLRAKPARGVARRDQRLPHLCALAPIDWARKLVANAGLRPQQPHRVLPVVLERGRPLFGIGVIGKLADALRVESTKLLCRPTSRDSPPWRHEELTPFGDGLPPTEHDTMRTVAVA